MSSSSHGLHQHRLTSTLSHVNIISHQHRLMQASFHVNIVSCQHDQHHVMSTSFRINISHPAASTFQHCLNTSHINQCCQLSFPISKSTFLYVDLAAASQVKCSCQHHHGRAVHIVGARIFKSAEFLI